MSPVDAAEIRRKLEPIRQRLAAASEAPWNADCHLHLARGCRCLSCHDDPTGWFLDTPTTLCCDEFVAKLGPGAENDFQREVTSCEDGPFTSYADADFAACARVDIPFLLDLVERLLDDERHDDDDPRRYHLAVLELRRRARRRGQAEPR